MGLFFTRPNTIAEAVRPRLRTAYLAQPKNDVQATTSAEQEASAIEHEIRPAFSVSRFVCAALFVIILFALYYLSAHDPKLTNHSDELFNLFEILTTGLTGVLVGEASARG